jgi:non-heme chloroperoxidase
VLDRASAHSFCARYEQPATKSGFATTLDAVKIHYLEAGKGPAILLVPGWTMPAWIWVKQIAHFSKSFHVIAMDPRAQGESTQASEGLYPAARARDIKAVVDQLKLAPVVLVGWSMGVTEICAYVDQFGTDGIADLVFVDGVPGFDLPPERLKGVIGFFGSFQKDRHKATEDFVRSMYKKPQAENYLQRVITASLATPTNSAAALSLGAMGSDYWGVLPKINRPRWWWQPSRRSSPRTRGCSGRFPGCA